MTFSDLKNKDVVNVTDGKKLGRPIDVVFNECACIEALVVPGERSFLNMLKGVKEGIEIPWARVKQIGDDVILVDLNANFFDT